MECIVCKNDGGKKTYVEELSKEVVLCDECLGEIESGELDGAVLRIILGSD